jgi:hypothetical protein
LARPEDAPDGRRERASVLDGWETRITAVLERFGDPRVGGQAMDRIEASVVHGVLRREFGFTGSHQSVRRHLTRHYPARPMRVVRRVERGTIKKCGNERQTVAPSRVSPSPPGESRPRKGATAHVEDRHPLVHVKPNVADARNVHS